MKRLIVLLSFVTLVSPAFSAEIPQLLTELAGKHATLTPSGEVIEVVADPNGNVGYKETPAGAATIDVTGPVSETTFQVDATTGAVTQTTQLSATDSAVHNVIVYTKEANDFEVDSARCNDQTCIPASFKVSLQTLGQ